MNRAIHLLTILAGLAFVLAAPARAATSAPFMMTTGATNPPIGHFEFCKRYPAECDQTSRSDTPMRLTPERWKTMLGINHQVNSTVDPVTDMDEYGVQEYWAYPKAAGDCEDYVLAKRRALMEDGFPASDLLITVVLQPNGDGHAVLTVHTDRGDFILDNMRNRVALWSDTEYTYVKRQSSLNSRRWDKISDDRPALVGSVR